MENQNSIISFLLEENILDKPATEKLISEQTESGKNLITILKNRRLIDKNQLTKLRIQPTHH